MSRSIWTQSCSDLSLIAGGARGILLWRREPLTFCVILDDATVEKGEKVTCNLDERAGMVVNEVRISYKRFDTSCRTLSQYYIILNHH